MSPSDRFEALRKSAVSLKRLSDERSLPVQWSASTGADGQSDWNTHRGTATTTVGTDFESWHGP
jgi:hypothetical protein